MKLYQPFNIAMWVLGSRRSVNIPIKALLSLPSSSMDIWFNFGISAGEMWYIFLSLTSSNDGVVVWLYFFLFSYKSLHRKHCSYILLTLCVCLHYPSESIVAVTICARVLKEIWNMRDGGVFKNVLKKFSSWINS